MITNINNGYYVHWLLSAMAKRPTMALDPSFRRWIDVTIIISMHSRFLRILIHHAWALRCEPASESRTE